MPASSFAGCARRWTSRASTPTRPAPGTPGSSRSPTPSPRDLEDIAHFRRQAARHDVKIARLGGVFGVAREDDPVIIFRADDLRKDRLDLPMTCRFQCLLGTGVREQGLQLLDRGEDEGK